MAMVDNLAKLAAGADGVSDVEALMGKTVPGTSKTGRDCMNDAVNVLRENMQLKKAAQLKGTLAKYVHHNGKVGVLVAFDGPVSADLGSAICMQIAAMNPLAVTRDKVDPALVETERKVAVDQAAASGKPKEIAEKMAVGKLNKWYSQVVLLEQPFVRDDKQTVEQVLKSAGKTTVVDFVRMAVGEI